MTVQVYEIDNGECPYLPDRRWVTHSFHAADLPDGLYEEMLRDGWRRSGSSFYRNRCPGCRCCTPVRVPVADFKPSRSQRRVIRRNLDIEVSVVPLDTSFEVFDLYRTYVSARHTPPEVTGETAQVEGEEQFIRFLGHSPVSSRCMLYRLNTRLIGVGWVDVLPDGLSSVYFAFHPDESHRSLGTFSIIKEIELARESGKSWLYLGFYVPESPKMAYKGSFAPREFAVNGRWTERESDIDCIPGERPVTQ